MNSHANASKLRIAAPPTSTVSVLEMPCRSPVRRPAVTPDAARADKRPPRFVITLLVASRWWRICLAARNDLASFRRKQNRRNYRRLKYGRNPTDEMQHATNRIGMIIATIARVIDHVLTRAMRLPLKQPQLAQQPSM